MIPILESAAVFAAWFAGTSAFLAYAHWYIADVAMTHHGEYEPTSYADDRFDDTLIDQEFRRRIFKLPAIIIIAASAALTAYGMSVGLKELSVVGAFGGMLMLAAYGWITIANCADEVLNSLGLERKRR